MSDGEKTREQLLLEVLELRQRITELENSEAGRKPAEKALRASEETLRALTEKNDALLKNEMRYRGLVETIEDWIWEVDKNGLYTYASPGVRDILGYEPREIIGKTPFDLMPPEEAERVAEIFREIVSEYKPIVSLENSNIHKNGGLVVLETSGKPFFDLNGTLLGYRGVDRDITERKRMQDLIASGKKEWEETFDIINDAITIHAKDFTIIRANKAAEKMLGLPFLDILGRKCYQLYHGSDSPPEGCPAREALKTGTPFTVELFEPHVNKFLEVKAFPLFDTDHQIIKVVHLIRDITEHKRIEAQLHVMSITDELTGLYNRRGFFTLAEQQLRIAKRQKKGMFLLCADLDDLKAINDRYGHYEGDRVLRETTTILRETFRESDIIARIGGDEFVVLQIEDSATTSGLLVSRLTKSIEIHNTQKDYGYKLSLSVGIAYYEPESTSSIHELLLQADALMYEQKKRKRKSQDRRTRSSTRNP